ncbi:hypothetical protein NL676_010755 [Syzygium grande]|nr:hypothetical protein NL676_010755 [Syzygium grande]
MSNPEPRAPRGRAAQGQAGGRGRAQDDHRLDRIMQALETMANLMGQQAHNQAAAVARNNVLLAGNGIDERQMPRLVEQFLKLKPSKFAGTSDPEATTLWVKELEKTFALLRCLEKDKVTLAIYQLQVDQYEAKFANPVKHAPVMVKIPKDKAKRFWDGLKPKLQSQLVPLNLKDYNELYE